MSYWIRTKTNRLKAPVKKALKEIDVSGVKINWSGDPVAKVDDYVYMTGAGVSAGTVGRVVALEDFGDDSGKLIHSGNDHWWSAEVETLDGKINSGWLWTMTVLPYNAVQEVKDFYVNDGRPERIKVSW
jgi:hypothetical protein